MAGDGWKHPVSLGVNLPDNRSGGPEREPQACWPGPYLKRALSLPQQRQVGGATLSPAPEWEGNIISKVQRGWESGPPGTWAPHSVSTPLSLCTLHFPCLSLGPSSSPDHPSARSSIFSVRKSAPTTCSALPWYTLLLALSQRGHGLPQTRVKPLWRADAVLSARDGAIN